jgi:ABC-type amino acid transport substrate-binding protein
VARNRSRPAAAALLLAASGAAAWAQGLRAPLAVCVAEDNPPLSYMHQGRPRGLDVRIAQALADALGRELKLVPFDSQYEKESSLAQEVNALLSAGVCEAASGFPLLAADLGAPPRASAKVPDHPGAPRKRDRPFVPLGSLAASRAYLAAALTAVMRAPVAPGISSLKQLRGQPEGAAAPWRIAAISGSTGSALALGWNFGALRPQLLSLPQNDDALQAVAQGRADAALVPLAQWDGWRLRHPDAPLAATPWRKPLGLNLGFVVLQGREDLRSALNGVLEQAQRSGQLRQWAEEAGVSWMPPQAPELAGAFSLQAWLAD